MECNHKKNSLSDALGISEERRKIIVNRLSEINAGTGKKSELLMAIEKEKDFSVTEKLLMAFMAGNAMSKIDSIMESVLGGGSGRSIHLHL